MAFVQVSASVQTTSGSSLSPTLNSVVSGNSLIYAVGHWNGGTPAASPPTNYAEDVESAASGGGKVAIGSRHGAPSGTNTPSIGLAASSWGRAFLLEYDPLTTAEATNSSTGNSTSASSGAVTPSASTSILIGAVSHTDVQQTITPNASWTQRAESEDVNSGQPINIEERTGVTGSQTATWTIGGTGSLWAGAVVSYPVGTAAAKALSFRSRSTRFFRGAR